jgi:hypothetical protein
MRCPNCSTDNPPGAKFCNECAAPLPLRCPSCGTDNPPVQSFAMSARRLLPKAKRRKGERGKDTGRRTSDAGRSDGERRQLTVMFCDWSIRRNCPSNSTLKSMARSCVLINKPVLPPSQKSEASLGQVEDTSQTRLEQVTTSQGKSQVSLETEAEACFMKAITIAHKQQAKSLELRAVMSLVRLRQRQAQEHAPRNPYQAQRSSPDVIRGLQLVHRRI